jgi:hypothetical protein
LRVSRKNLGINYQRIFLEKVIFESWSTLYKPNILSDSSV